MKTPDQDPFDALLDQSLQSASHCLDSEKFRIQLAGRIAAEQRRMKLLRLLPSAMGLLTAAIIFLTVHPKFDFHIGFSTLATLSDQFPPVPAWLMASLPGTPNLIVPWAISAGAALVFSLWLTSRDTTVFRL